MLHDRATGVFFYDLRKSKIIQQLAAGEYSSAKDISYFEAKATGSTFFVATSDGVKKFTIRMNAISYNKDGFDFLPSGYNKNAFGLCIDKEKNVWYSNEDNLIKVNPHTKK